MTKWEYDGFAYRRRSTRTVRVGDVSVGSSEPIRVQSMTTPATQDVAATVAQIERLVDVGCEIVRVTVPTTRDADALPGIRSALERLRIRVPLVADIHFTPAAAMKAVEYVDKVRVNPGNYADKKKFNVREYTDSQYAEELERIAEVFTPLVLRSKELGRSMRIGTNHGSLSDRIMNRYGDSPEGMVESALEFVRICEGHGYHDLILSMKASNPVVVQQVYRLLATRMAAEGMHYPFHLGVTEAGDGEDGRIKSAIGIGGLLDEGIGDTVRVSLTEDPVAEIPVCQRLVAPFNARHAAGDTAPRPLELRTPVEETRDPYAYVRRQPANVPLGPHTAGAGQPVLVEVPLVSSLGNLDDVRRELDAQVGARVPEETRADVVSVSLGSAEELPALEKLRESILLVAPRVALSARAEAEWLSDAVDLAEGGDDTQLTRWVRAANRLHVRLDAALGDVPFERVAPLLRAMATHDRCLLIEAADSEGDLERAVDLAVDVAGLVPDDAANRLLLTLAPSAAWSPLHGMRLLTARLEASGMDVPLVLLDHAAERRCDALLGTAASLGGLLCDGIGDAVQIHAPDATESRRQAFTILQSARVRITRTEFISCPSCGRTLFDLEETTARIKDRTGHLKGVKIAVMGCIVNGPGEMADADFGYVGWGEDKIALFVGKDMVERDIPTDRADGRLVELIKEHGRWVDPPVHATEAG